jgi:putative ABC transport system substrate-binding protein
MMASHAVLALIVTLTVGPLIAPFAADAQQAPKVPRVGVLFVGNPASTARNNEAFTQGLRELGWVEGQNIVIEYRFAEGQFNRLRDLAAELVRLKVDVLVVSSVPGALAAKNATQTIPIVFLGVGDPVESGLVASLARPGGNLTGLSLLNLGLSGKRMELLKECLPSVLSLTLLYNT